MEKQKSEEHRTVRVFMDRDITVKPADTFESEVIAFGNTARIPFPKKYIGRNVLVILR